MLSNGWFWMFLAFFFMMGPMRMYRRRGVAWGRWDRWGPDGPQETLRNQQPSKEDLEQQQRRDEQVEQLEARVNELESRLDFAERLLAPRRDPVASPKDSP